MKKSRYRYYCLWKNEFDYYSAILTPILLVVLPFVVAVICVKMDWPTNFIGGVVIFLFVAWVLAEYSKLLALNNGRFILCLAIWPLRYLSHFILAFKESEVKSAQGDAQKNAEWREHYLNKFQLGDAERHARLEGKYLCDAQNAQLSVSKYKERLRFRMRKYNTECISGSSARKATSQLMQEVPNNALPTHEEIETSEPEEKEVLGKMTFKNFVKFTLPQWFVWPTAVATGIMGLFGIAAEADSTKEGHGGVAVVVFFFGFALAMVALGLWLHRRSRKARTL